ncbi:MAG: hypothetical protein IJ752_09030 [Alphaproteobacteria bacterium]|nr:hypothetical protein [Alphaproteobacteria bacterium]
MKTKQILQTVGLFLVSGCALTHYDSLDQKPETDIAVSSNIPAEVWINGQKIQSAAKEHILKQTGMDIVELKAKGYHDARVIVYRSQPEKKNVTSHESSVVWTTQESGDITSNLSELGADAATTSPTSTVMLIYNVGKFVVDLVALPFSFTTEFNPFGYYFAYDKNQFYVEMMPLSASEAKVFDAFKLQVKKFVLKNYTELAKGNREYIAALARFSGLTQGDINSVLASVSTPADAADAIAARLTAAHVE